LDPPLAEKAFDNICTLLGAKSALFVDGTDPPVKLKMTRKHRLAPLDYKLEDIHNEARWARAAGYPDLYWGLEPFLSVRSDWKRRYATVFLKGG
jgi:hypothetical protein